MTLADDLKARAPYKRVADILGADLYGWTRGVSMSVVDGDGRVHQLDEWTAQAILKAVERAS